MPSPAPSPYLLSEPEPLLRVSGDDVRAMVAEPEQVVLDVRSAAEYDGDCFWPSGAVEEAGRAGHVPAACTLIEKFRTEDGRFRDPDECGRPCTTAVSCPTAASSVLHNRQPGEPGVVMR